MKQKTVAIMEFGKKKPVARDVEHFCEGDYGYRKKEGDHVWTTLKGLPCFKKGSPWSVTHIPSGLMVADNLLKKNAAAMVRDLAKLEITWNGKGTPDREFLSQVSLVRALYVPKGG